MLIPFKAREQVIALCITACTSKINRFQVWINPGFQEQLVLFEVCQYAPSPNEGVYKKWRYSLEQTMKAEGLT